MRDPVGTYMQTLVPMVVIISAATVVAVRMACATPADAGAELESAALLSGGASPNCFGSIPRSAGFERVSAARHHCTCFVAKVARHRERHALRR